MKNDFEEVFQKEFDKFKEQNPQYLEDNRPVTGMVGQKCEGFYTDSKGHVIRLLPPERGEEYIGPGSYSPQDTTKKLGPKISSNSKRLEFAQPTHKVGPSDHYNQLKSTKIPHQIQNRPTSFSFTVNSSHDPTFLSGNLEHKNWCQISNPTIPQRRFPQTKFSKTQNSPQFLSKQTRVLFPVHEDELGDNLFITHNSSIKVSDRASAVFCENQNRFPDYTSTTPSPCQYTIPNLSQGRKTSLEPTWTELDIDPPEITPGPGSYDLLPKKAIVPPPRNRIVPRNLLPKRTPNVTRTSFETPAPGSYDISFDDSKIPMMIRPKSQIQSNDWAMTPELLTKTPKVGSYNISSQHQHIKGGVMSLAGRKDLAMERLNKEQDHELQYSTQHRSLFKKSFNSRYYRNQRNHSAFK